MLQWILIVFGQWLIAQPQLIFDGPSQTIVEFLDSGSSIAVKDHHGMEVHQQTALIAVPDGHVPRMRILKRDIHQHTQPQIKAAEKQRYCVASEAHQGNQYKDDVELEDAGQLGPIRIYALRFWHDRLPGVSVKRLVVRLEYQRLKTAFRAPRQQIPFGLMERWKSLIINRATLGSEVSTTAELDLLVMSPKNASLYSWMREQRRGRQSQLLVVDSQDPIAVRKLIRGVLGRQKNVVSSVQLVGSRDAIPSFLFLGQPTDYDYSLVDSSSDLPDLMVSRIPVDDPVGLKKFLQKNSSNSHELGATKRFEYVDTEMYRSSSPFIIVPFSPVLKLPEIVSKDVLALGCGHQWSSLDWLRTQPRSLYFPQGMGWGKSFQDSLLQKIQATHQSLSWMDALVVPIVQHVVSRDPDRIADARMYQFWGDPTTLIFRTDE